MRQLLFNTVILFVLIISASDCKTISSYPLAFYEVESKGSPSQMKVRMISDYSSIIPNQEFKIGLFFKLKEGWYTYTNKTGIDNLPTVIDWILPAGFEIIEEEWPSPNKRMGKSEGESELVYDEDFIVKYTIRSAEKLSGNEILKANASWQVCKSELCTLGGAEIEYEIQTGKKRKSDLYKLLR